MLSKDVGAADLADFFARPIAFHPSLARAAGSVTGGLLLSQAIYWQGKRQGYFYKSGAQWCEETALSLDEFKLAKKRLVDRGLLLCEVRSMPAVSHYTVDYEAVLRALRETRQQAGGKATNWQEGNTPACRGDSRHPHTKTLSETPTNTCPLAADVWGEVVKTYPKRIGNDPLSRAVKAWNARIREGAKPEDMLAGVTRYAAFCKSTNKVDTEIVMMRATFFGPDKAFEQSFGLAPAAGSPHAAELVAGQWWKTSEGVTAKGRSMGVDWPPEDQQPPGWFFAYKCRVLVRAGDGPWMETVSPSEKRVIEEIREKVPRGAPGEVQFAEASHA